MGRLAGVGLTQEKRGAGPGTTVRRLQTDGVWDILINNATSH
ncbi:hypothetical protein Sinac_2537 [Singulisphaera acidiphila DSM 18658]|uniref:Uncharacterized protein n=1 Tax=Singulisphaera acidiphila (strain ATCC BAA-1392 / DSM 18658 / VKM B-2454 / MOB10) TaxID=886293 RepID=L0DBV1_SINAD|nr:hypothetical protein Sinac_2537 [Singulisphaera acidiphila DSM 18658]